MTGKLTTQTMISRIIPRGQCVQGQCVQGQCVQGQCVQGWDVPSAMLMVLLLTVTSGLNGLWGDSSGARAQSVILPMPRLLTTMPMGGTAGETLEITITGQHLDGERDLRFSDPRISTEPVLDGAGNAVPDKYRVSIDKDCPAGLVEARVWSRLGLSSPRVFTISTLPEVTQGTPSMTLETAMPLELNSICNAVMPPRAVNHYRFGCDQGQRVVIDCAARGIDSKLNPVLILGDAQGRDLVVQRRGDGIDFTAPESGPYVIKVHELTFKGGPEFFYRLSLRTVPPDEMPPASPATQAVSAFSWPPFGLASTAAIEELEPNDTLDDAQPISLPCDVAGRFATAADVDLFRFSANKGEVWWVEVASERLVRPTDPSLIVQRLVESGDGVTLVDVAELNDIPSPVKVSSNAYAYDGPPYQAGSPDVLGRVEIPEDGEYLIRLVDLFGGTRSDPRNVYRMVVRQAAPDFVLVAWAMHMELRNGDRNAVSKPIALRPGSTMPLEVVVIRRDGFDGPIELAMENLPDGLRAQGITIAAGENRGWMLVTADEGAPPGAREARLLGRATIDGQLVERPCRIASMAWPVTDHWSEIPSPRLLKVVAVSVGDTELAPITISPREQKLWEVREGEPLSIPLVHMLRSEFSGSVMNASTLGKGFERFKCEIPLTADHSDLVIDLAALKTPPGDYVIALYGGAVAKYRAPVEAGKRVDGAAKQITELAPPRDIVDIVVSEPISIRVKPAEKQ